MPSKSLRLPLACSLLALAMVSVAPTASAQTPPTVSDADRAAARELATQGLQLQQAGNFTDALDRFDRAQAVFSAPTHLLHIAQCEASLGKLVEAAETYRTLVRTPLPSGAPNAFVQAQAEGAAELAQVEPRIPAIRVLVRPRVQPNMTIQIDGQAVSTALVGVQRPTDPGTHAVVLLAPGYARAEQKIVLNEKETKDVAFNLGGTQPSFYPPPSPTYGARPNASPSAPRPSPSGWYVTEAVPDRPSTGSAEPEKPRGGFMLGASLGLLVPGGNLYSGTGIGAAAKPGLGVEVVGGFRFVRRLYVGLTFQHGFLGTGSGGGGGSNVWTAAAADSNYIGIDFGVISHPDGVGFYGKISGGYRFLQLGLQDTGTPASYSQTYQGGEFSLAAGVHIKVGDWVRLIPLVSISAGQFGTTTCSGAPVTANCGSISDGDNHLFVLLGVTAFVDFARKH